MEKDKKWDLYGLPITEITDPAFPWLRGVGVPHFPQRESSGIVWVFYWPSLLRGRTGAGPAHSLELAPSPSLHRTVKPREGVVPTPPAGPGSWG